MFATIAFVIASGPTDPLTIPAAESVWVYTHAGDPAGDEFIRVWGVGGMATPEGKGEGDDWSYGYVKWDAASLPDGSPKSATLTVYNANPPSFGDASAVANTPLQARGLVGSFSGKTWDFSMAVKVHPDLAKTVFGAGTPKPWGESKDPVAINIDLMKGPGDFKAYFAAAKSSDTHALCLALTSAIDPSTAEGGSGKAGVFKVFSAAARDAKFKPLLTLEY